MDTDEITLSSPIEEKIAWAEHRYESFSGPLIQDKPIVDYLTSIENAIQASHKEMGETGILDICRDCEKNEGGSCCGAGLENKYDGRLLLINLLLDVRLPRKRHDKESCFFLGVRFFPLPAFFSSFPSLSPKVLSPSARSLSFLFTR